MWSPASGFVGYYTVDGPKGYIEADSEATARDVAACLRQQFPKALSGPVRYSIWSKKYWITIWTRS